jgi:sigma-B regulation protein RsbU (phosphoserine phosphatase)
MEHLNQHVCQLDEGFITVCLAVLDPKCHTLSVANAGHPSPFLRHGDGTIMAVESERNSYPLGLVADAQFHPITLSLSIGDEFVLFTDGVTEAFDCDRAIYGLERLICALREPAVNTARRVQQLVNDIESFRRTAKYSDDQCIVAVARTGT